MAIVLAAVLAVTAGAGFWLYRTNVFGIELMKNGPDTITVEYGGRYAEPGASAEFSGTLLMRTPRPVPVDIAGAVDTGKPGSYTVSYTAAYILHFAFWEQIFEARTTRTVEVVDTKAPVITLVADPEVYTLPGRAYEEEGFLAVDNCDGDITDRVERTAYEDRVVYSVSDSSGNSAEVVRQIRFDDPIPPVITLKGGATLTLEWGEKYTDPGCTAEDNCDGDITGQVKISGKVDSHIAGRYILTYSVSDEWGNAVSCTRTVQVKEKPQPVEPPEFNGKVIYLTFDDGPSQYTEKLLDVLDKYDVKVTFFVTKNSYADMITRAAKAGHSIGAHTACHEYGKIYASEKAYYADLQEVQEHIARCTGRETSILRFPGGSSNAVSKQYCPGLMTALTQSVTEKGYTYFDWNVDSFDAGGAKTADEVYRNVTSAVSKRQVSVVLQHDIKGFSVDAVERIIQWGLENGYTFLPLSPESPACHHRLNN